MTETVKLQVTADASKVNPELAKVQKDLGQLAASTKRLEEGFGKFGSRLTQAFSLGAITAFMVKINSAADQLNDLSDRLGASASGLQAIQLAAAQAGGSAEAASNALGKMSATIGDAMVGNKQAVQSFDRLGLSVQELSAMKADEAFRTIADAVSKIPNSFERLSIAQDIYGKGAKEIIGLLAQGGAAIDEVNKRLEEQGARLNDLDVKKIGVMNDQLAFQATVVQNLGAKFLTGLTPAVNVAVDSFANMLGSLGGASEGGKTFGVVMIAAIKTIEAAAYGLVAVFETVREIVAGVLAVISGGVPNLVGGFATMADAVGLDGLAGKLGAASQFMHDMDLTLSGIAQSASMNADKATQAAVRAGGEFLRASALYDEFAAKLNMAAGLAASSNPAALAGSGGAYDPNAARAGAYSDPGRTSGRQGGGITLGDPAGAKAAAAAPVDPTLDPQVLYQSQVYGALQTAYDEYSGSMLGKIDAFQSTWLGSMLTSNQAQIDAEMFKNLSIGDMMGQFAEMAMQHGGRLGKIGKAFAIAQTIWTTSGAVMRAMQEIPYPANFGVAASVAAMGAMKLATIKSTNIGSGGSLGSVSGATPGMGATAALPASVPATRSTESDQRSAVNIYVEGNLMSGPESVRWLAEQLGTLINGNDLVYINGNSRQAMVLRGE